MDEEPIDRLTYIRNQQFLAYEVAPTGSWFKRWIPGVCKHELVRCTHGDEIIHRKFRRRACLICGRSLKGYLPRNCFFTGGNHPSLTKDYNYAVE